MAHKPEPAEDLRIQRTRKLLQDAMIQLTVEKGFEAITVADIAERAMVNRSTFYRHYLDKYDLLHRFMDDVHRMIVAREDRRLTQSAPRGPVMMLRHIQEFSEFYRQMLGAKGDPHFVQRFRANSERRYRELLAEYASPSVPGAPPVDMRVSYASYAGVGAILWWLENDQPCTVEQLAAWLSQLMMSSVGLSFPDVSST